MRTPGINEDGGTTLPGPVAQPFQTRMGGRATSKERPMSDLLKYAMSQLAPAQYLIRHKYELRPILTFDGQKFGIVSVPDYSANEIAAQKAIREMLEEFGAARYAFTMHVEKIDGKEEAILVQAGSVTGEKVTVLCKVIEKDGKIEFAEPGYCTGPSGPLCDLLDRKPTVH